ncbi:putative eka-like protein [Erysiphe necator]|uniref:Putative eka-like protein n=1 Tax=Uncinula necator TaxID=52586 RepID=A0A0B1PCN4_UNCNE|nr:putative eka-like protein [Erysiphe necator]
MPAIRTKRQFSMVDIAKSRARARLKNKGLAPDLIDIDTVEASILDTESPDIEMIDAEIDRLIAKGLKESRWATPQAQAASSTKATTVDSTQLIVIKDMLAPTPEAESRAQKDKGIAAQRPITIDLTASQISSLSHNKSISITEPQASLNINETGKEKSYPPELQAIFEAEKRRAAQTAANLEVCTAAINGVETALLPLRVKT